MSSQDHIKELRDRFLAFSFASADLFLEVDQDGKIIFVFGASKGLTGAEEDVLKGKHWHSIFHEKEHEKLKQMREEAKDGKRCGPLLITLSVSKDKQAIVCAIKMPGSNSFYLALGFYGILGSTMMDALQNFPEFERTQEIKEEIADFGRTEAIQEKQQDVQRTQTIKEEIADFGRTEAIQEKQQDVQRTQTIKEEIADFGRTEAIQEKQQNVQRTQTKPDPVTEIIREEKPGGEKIIAEFVLDKDNYTLAAQQAMEDAKAQGMGVDVTMLDFTPTKDDKHRMGPDIWKNLIHSIEHMLLEASIDGQTAAAISEGRYSLVHNKQINSQDLREKIFQLAKKSDPTGEGIDIRHKTIDADLDKLSNREAARAHVYSMNEFERDGTELSIDSFVESLKTYTSSNTDKVKEFKSIIERQHFQLHFQPIVNLDTLEATHYEILSRFENGDTQEWVMFGEDVGMAADFDLAVCERAINYLSFKGSNSRSKFSVNLSGQSIENSLFHEKLMNMLHKDSRLSQRLIFEITESSYITDLERVNKFIQILHNAGFGIALDDFGAGASSFEYLQKLEVDYVKIDGKYIRNITHSKRDLAMVRNLVKMCKEMQIQVVGEFVETEEHFHILKDIGVDYGQGYFFGKPSSRPEYMLNNALLAKGSSIKAT